MTPSLRAVLLATLASSFATGAALAQETPVTVPTPVPTPVATPEIAPTPSPTPVASPTPSAVPTPTPTPTPRAVEREASPRPTPTPAAAVSPAPTPAASPSPMPAPAASPSATVPAIVAPLPTTGREEDRPRWPWMLGAAVIALGGIGLWLARRQPVAAEEAAHAAEEVPVAVPVPVEVGPSPRLALSFRPTRVGFNMLSATVEGELTLANDGDVAAEDVRVRAGLFGAHAGQDSEIAAFVAEPIGRPTVPPFALAPGERRAVRIVVATPRAGLRTMTAAGRPMFVPILAVNVLMAGERQVAQAFAVGAERVDSAKLAPFWLDVPDRGYTEVAARPHGVMVER